MKLEAKWMFLLLGGASGGCVSPAVVDRENVGASSSRDDVDTKEETKVKTVEEKTLKEKTLSGVGGGAPAKTEKTVAAGGASALESDEKEVSLEFANICPFDGALSYNPDAAYPFCQPPLGSASSLSNNFTIISNEEEYLQRCRFTVAFNELEASEGVGMSHWSSVAGSPDGAALNYCTCQDNCLDDTDCAEPESGTAQASCLEKTCLLTCDDAESCPDGMTCTTSEHLGSSICAWGTRGDACEPSALPDVTPGTDRSFEDYCPFSAEDIVHDPTQAYPFCQMDTSDGAPDYCGVDSELHWEPGDCVQGSCGACACTPLCSDDTECPAAPDGDASPSCSPQGCLLACDDGETCPSGMECTRNGTLNRSICAWQAGGELCGDAELNF